MPNRDDAWRAWALLLARVVLGLIFAMAGFYKVFDLGPVEHARRYFVPYQDMFLPVWSLWLTGTVVPLVELVAGIMVLIGWKAREACLALGAVLALVTFGHLLGEPLYAFNEHVIPRLALVLFILVMPAAADRFALDRVLRRDDPTS